MMILSHSSHQWWLRGAGPYWHGTAGWGLQWHHLSSQAVQQNWGQVCVHCEDYLYVHSAIKLSCVSLVVAVQIFSLNLVLTPFIAGYIPNYFYLWHTMVNILLLLYRQYNSWTCIIIDPCHRSTSAWCHVDFIVTRRTAGTIFSLIFATLLHICC